MSTPDVTTHTYQLSSPIWLAQTAIRDPHLVAFFLSSDPHCATPSDCASGDRPQRLLTFRACAATVPSDTQEGRWDIKVTGASGGFREPGRPWVT